MQVRCGHSVATHACTGHVCHWCGSRCSYLIFRHTTPPLPPSPNAHGGLPYIVNVLVPNIITRLHKWPWQIHLDYIIDRFDGNRFEIDASMEYNMHCYELYVGYNV